jgi:alginate O-acetyltransferase complex protein AlgI
MAFSSVEFLFAFLPLFLILQLLFPRNLGMALFSLVFYFIGEGWFSALVLVSLLMNFAFGLAIDSQKEVRPRKLILALAVAANLALLIFFKYAGFLAENLFAADAQSWIRQIHLPLGISFFTFHAMSYLIDIYRYEAKVERSLSNLAVYILMFPQLIAGPILRYAAISRQLRERMVTARHVYYGLCYFAFGLGQKTLIADQMASIADPLFNHWTELSTTTAWLAAVAYTFQIYFDFGGYSNMAIGLAFLSGFDFPINFNYPYISRSITEFWRRWHISLSSWFRDYLYIPLGGNRHGELRTYLNLATVFLLCGLWHGAAWTYILWGLYHGVLLVVERIGFSRALLRLADAAQHVYAMLAVIVGWVIFRSDSFEQSIGILRRMFVFSAETTLGAEQFVANDKLTAMVFAAVLSTPICYAILQKYVALPMQRPWPELGRSAYVIGAMLTSVLFLASAVKIYTGAYSPFIYFRF